MPRLARLLAGRRHHAQAASLRKEEARLEAAELLDQVREHEALVQRPVESPCAMLRDRERIGRPPGLARSAERRDERRERQARRRAPVREAGIHAGGVGLEALARRGRQPFGLALGETGDAEDAHLAVGLEGVVALHFGEAALRRAPQPDELRQPVLRMDEAEAEVGVALARGEHVRHAVAVAQDAQRSAQRPLRQAAPPRPDAQPAPRAAARAPAPRRRSLRLRRVPAEPSRASARGPGASRSRVPTSPPRASPA